MDRDYSATNKAKRSELRQAQAKQRAQQQLAAPHDGAQTMHEDGLRDREESDRAQLYRDWAALRAASDAPPLASPASSSHVTQLAAPDGGAAQPNSRDDSHPAATTVEQHHPDGGVAQPNSSDVTQLAAPETGAAQPTAMQDPGGMQCPECDRILCGAQQLAFFRRINKHHGFEVHLMMKPELLQAGAEALSMPPAFILMPTCAQGAVASWQCACGHKLGDTRNVGPKRAPMTAFKSSSVKLFGQHHNNKKSQWPRIFANPPFDGIEVRDWEEFHA